jgi:radical SAM protein with 4Fe4S-binding SPASM domain
MLQSKKNLLINTFKKRGIKGITDLGKFFIEKETKPDKVHYSPSTISIEITTLCNLKCKMCTNSSIKNGGNMDMDKFKKFIDSNPFIQKINLTGIGESLMHPKLIEMINYIKRKNIYAWFVNNMTLMNKKIGQELVDSKVDLICVSIDGANKKTFEEIRVGAKFEQVLDNTKQFLQIKNRPPFGMNMVVTKENYKEIEDVVKLANNLKIDHLTFKSVYSVSKDSNMFDFVSKEELNKYVSKAKKTAKELGVNVLTWPISKKPKKPSKKSHCSMPWINPYIAFNGDVFPCCFILQEVDGRYKDENIMGNVFKEDFKKIWNSEKYVSFRKRIKTNTPPHSCKYCPNYYGLW